MAIDLTNLNESSLAFDKELAAGEIELIDENIELPGPVRIKGEVRRDGVEIIATGVIEADASINCTRCMTPVEHKLSVPFDVKYLSAEAAAERESDELDASELDAAVIPEDGLELADLAREQIVLSVPMQFFCKPDCKGLCTICGGNRNLIDCNCGEKEIDPRWAALKDIN